MTTRTFTAMAAAALLSLSSLAAQAHTIVYSGPLLGSSEVPAVTTTGSGSATITVDYDLATMRVQASFSGLTGNVTAAHIHCCTAPGANVGVATMTPTFSGFPSGVTAGSYDQTFDLSLASSYNAAFITANGGTVAGAFAALGNGLDAGQAYFNLHTSTFGGGEIRGLLVAVPEPSTWALALAGLAVLGGVARRRQRV